MQEISFLKKAIGSLVNLKELRHHKGDLSWLEGKDLKIYQNITGTSKQDTMANQV